MKVENVAKNQLSIIDPKIIIISYYNHKWCLSSLSVSDATVFSVTLKSSIMTPEVSFTIVYDVYKIGITVDDHNMFIVQSTGHSKTQSFRYVWTVLSSAGLSCCS